MLFTNFNSLSNVRSNTIGFKIDISPLVYKSDEIIGGGQAMVRAAKRAYSWFWPTLTMAEIYDSIVVKKKLNVDENPADLVEGEGLGQVSVK